MFFSEIDGRNQQTDNEDKETKEYKSHGIPFMPKGSLLSKGNISL